MLHKARFIDKYDALKASRPALARGLKQCDSWRWTTVRAAFSRFQAHLQEFCYVASASGRYSRKDGVVKFIPLCGQNAGMDW